MKSRAIIIPLIGVVPSKVPVIRLPKQKPIAAASRGRG
jgi:hypothetical protein